MKNAWSWLGRARSISKEIYALEEEKQNCLETLTRVTQSYNSDGAQSTKDPHKFDRLAEYADRINQRIEDLYAAKQEIVDAICKLENGRRRTVLFEYYIRQMTVEQIAVELNCTFRNVQYIKKRGVQEIEKFL